MPICWLGYERPWPCFKVTRVNFVNFSTLPCKRDSKGTTGWISTTFYTIIPWDMPICSLSCEWPWPCFKVTGSTLLFSAHWLCERDAEGFHVSQQPHGNNGCDYSHIGPYVSHCVIGATARQGRFQGVWHPGLVGMRGLDNNRLWYFEWILFFTIMLQFQAFIYGNLASHREAIWAYSSSSLHFNTWHFLSRRLYICVALFACTETFHMLIYWHG